MNIQLIFDALSNDMDNSALGIVCSELEAQGYRVALNGVGVDSNGIFDGNHQNIENIVGPITVSLFKESRLEQEFSIEFIDYHEAIIKPKSK